MIDYNQPDDDPIVEEARRAGEAYAARFNFDVRAVFDDLRRMQATSGRHYVNLPLATIKPRSFLTTPRWETAA
jgi:hypothetical protein